MRIRDIFFLSGGRTVFTGPIAEGEVAVIEPGVATVIRNGQTFATIHIEREVIPSRALPLERLETRALSTRDITGLTKEMVANEECYLEGTMRYAGHRHLPGLESPPRDYVADDMTLGPRLPEGWDGDAWMKSDGGGYFLRAWKATGDRYAVALGDKYEEARKNLLDAIAAGGKQVQIRVTEPSA
jgi:hypothetical protein